MITALCFCLVTHKAVSSYQLLLERFNNTAASLHICMYTFKNDLIIKFYNQLFLRIVESVCRSLNNLMERFHQSFFFYLLPSTYRYISIGVYMRPLGLILLAPLLQISFLCVYVCFELKHLINSTLPVLIFL